MNLYLTLFYSLGGMEVKAKYIIQPKEIKRGSKAYRSRESREPMYRMATLLVEQFWGNPRDMADALGIILLTWNSACYRYRAFDFSALENGLRQNMDLLKAYRGRDILNFVDSDNERVDSLFNSFLEALKVPAVGKSKEKRSPVAVAKALHVLCPNFFPLWDNDIAKGYSCYWYCSKNASAKYLAFLRISKAIVKEIKDTLDTGGTTLLKMVDEYNYAKFTKEWI